jgi:hypothetical protein
LGDKVSDGKSLRQLIDERRQQQQTSLKPVLGTQPAEPPSAAVAAAPAATVTKLGTGLKRPASAPAGKTDKKETKTAKKLPAAASARKPAKAERTRVETQTVVRMMRRRISTGETADAAAAAEGDNDADFEWLAVEEQVGTQQLVLLLLLLPVQLKPSAACT